MVTHGARKNSIKEEACVPLSKCSTEKVATIWDELTNWKRWEITKQGN